jgi:hypothetical protein
MRRCALVLLILGIGFWLISLPAAPDDEKSKPAAESKKTEKKRKPVVIEFDLDSLKSKKAEPNKGDNKSNPPGQSDQPAEPEKPKAKDSKKVKAKETAKSKPGAKDKLKPKKKGNEELPEFADIPETVCKICLDTGFVPLSDRRAYVHLEGERAPDPAVCVPWRHCPKCRGDREPEELVQVEKDRLNEAGASNAEWEKRCNFRLIRVEARHVALHCDMPADMARRQGQAAESLAAYLQQQTKSVYLTQTRPGTTEILYVWDKAKYLKMIELCKTIDEFKANKDWALLAQLSGFNGSITSIHNAETNKQLPPEHTTISRLAMRNLIRATNGNEPDWLRCGFAYTCEHSLTRKVLVHYVSYRNNEVRLGADWIVEARKYVSARQLIPWDTLFRTPLSDFMAADHVSSFAAVLYLFRTDPRKFVLYCFALRNREEPTPALERIYGKPLKQLQTDCARWISKNGT